MRVGSHLAVGYDRARHGIHNLSTPEVIADPTIYIDAIAELGPLFFDEVGQVWVCSGYRESAEVLTDFRRFSSARLRSSGALAGRGLNSAASVADMLVEQMLFIDPPKHAAIRSSIQNQFTASQVRERDEAMKAIVNTALNDLPLHGEIDLIAQFSQKLPSPLIAHLLDIKNRAKQITRWAEAYETLLGSLSTLPNIRNKEIIPVLNEALSFFQAEARTRLDSPRDDLISSMVAMLRGNQLSQEDTDALTYSIAANCIVLLGGGYQTLAHLVSTGLLLLDKYPAQQRRLREDPSLIDSAINEFMRLDGSSQYVARQATVDSELGGRHISASQTVIVHLAAANLDPRTFTDSRVLNIERREARHLGFSMGRHYCIGAPYAQRTARWGILGFLDRYPEYHVRHNSEDLKWGAHPNTRCLAHAYVHVKAGSQEPATESESITMGESEPSGQPTEPICTELAQPDQHLLTIDWNDTATPLGPYTCWHQLFEHRARLAPNIIAVNDGDDAHSYQEINQRANALARVLRTQGVQPEVVVGVVMERSADFIVTILAIAKAGGAFLLADTSCPDERLKDMLKEAAVTLVLADEMTAMRLASVIPPARLLTLDCQQTDATAPLSGASAGNTAYVVFTSGTTGRPKAIAISHEGVVNLHVAQRQIFRIGPHDRVLQFLSPNFDGCIADIVLALLSGAMLVVAPTVHLMVGPPLIRLLREQRITTVILTPSVWAALPEAELPDLRIAAAAGERLPAALVARWSRPGRRFLNLYGPAETAVLATWHECSDSATTPPIGRPVANKRTYVLDEQLRPIPIGQHGELCIGGLGIGRYLSRPELMEERFAIDPVGGTPGQLIYRTGDICRWLPDGSLEYLGRRDRQVKIRGQRVELEEIEKVIEKIPGVAASTVYEREGQLHALIVAERHGLDESTIREQLVRRLHSGMIPTTFTVVDKLPLTTNGKVNRGSVAELTQEPATHPALRAPNDAHALNTDIDISPQHSRLTWRISQIFADCLNLSQQRVKANSDFFSLGGDSLAMATFLTNLERETETLVDVRNLLNDPTPTGIATHIVGRDGRVLYDSLR
jgi:amino acid adenylation domain-containing protein